MPTESQPIELNIPAPKFNLPGVDGKMHSLESYQAAKILVVGFTCNHCPYVQAYEARLIELCDQFQNRGVAFVCINSNDDVAYPDDSFANMEKRAKLLKFNFDYLRDESQRVAKDFNAACTPEFYVYDQQRMLRYHGRLDDNHKDPISVKHAYLRDAIDQLLISKNPATAQTAAIGCGIKWKK